MITKYDLTLRQIDALEKVDSLIENHIKPRFDVYNGFNVKNSDNNKLYKYTENKVTYSMGGKAFALKEPSTANLINSEKDAFVDIVTRCKVPMELLSKESEEEIITNLYSLYVQMFNDIREKSKIKPLTPYVGNNYFDMRMIGKDFKYVRLCDDRENFIIRAMHGYLDIDAMGNENENRS